MARYHDYLTPNPDFDGMYANEDVEGYDSWRQFDLRPLQQRILIDLVEQEHFASLLDIGCGKGTLTHQWAKPGRRVIGYDVSEIALLKAQTMFPDVQWYRGDALDAVRRGELFDVVVLSQTLYLQSTWFTVLDEVAKICKRVVVNEYVPRHTQWHIPSLKILEDTFRTHYCVDTKIVFNEDRLFLAGKPR